MRRSFSFVLCCAALPVLAQDVHYPQFSATPLTLNPALTGAFDGRLRVSALYSNQSVTTDFPFTTVGGAIDLPIYTAKKGDFLALGVQVVKDAAGEGYRNNSSAIASLAGHKSFRLFSRDEQRNSVVAVGVQAGVTEQNTNLANLFFGGSRYNVYPLYPPPYIGPVISPNSATNTVLNAGITLAQTLAPHFNYIIGLAGHNLYQPQSAADRNRNVFYGIDKRYSIMAGADWEIVHRFSFRPAAYYQILEHDNYLIAGGECYYNTGKAYSSSRPAIGVYAGGWYLTKQGYAVTCGLQLRSVKVGFGYNHGGAAKNEGIDVSARYILARKLRGNIRLVPCSRL